MRKVLLLLLALTLGADEVTWLSEKQKRSEIAKVCLDSKIFYYCNGNLTPKLYYTVVYTGGGGGITYLPVQAKCK